MSQSDVSQAVALGNDAPTGEQLINDHPRPMKPAMGGAGIVEHNLDGPAAVGRNQSWATYRSELIWVEIHPSGDHLSVCSNAAKQHDGRDCHPGHQRSHSEPRTGFRP